MLNLLVVLRMLVRTSAASTLQETVTTALRPDGRGRTMAGQDCYVIAERQQLGLYSGNQVVMAAIGKIRAANRVCEQRVPDQRKALRAGDEHQMSGCVTREVQHVEA